MQPCGCHSNQGFHLIFIKSLCHQSPTRGMLQMRNDWDQPAECGDITGQRCWQTTDGQLSYKLLWSFWPRWAKKWLNYLQIVEILIRIHILHCLTITLLGTSRLKRVKGSCSLWEQLISVKSSSFFSKGFKYWVDNLQPVCKNCLPLQWQ